MYIEKNRKNLFWQKILEQKKHVDDAGVDVEDSSESDGANDPFNKLYGEIYCIPK